MREKMLQLFRNLGGRIVLSNGLVAKPAINEKGELHVNLYRNRRFYWSLTLEEFGEWAGKS